ncbi:MAG TPA: hypothetical protein P5572_10390 [Phycisphaerae bacterium]|nr:hypothetical protein [Phycisphaerales bacterium]HRX85415.1 hypothetical protein [Phycisphaerae bacterium]
MPDTINRIRNNDFSEGVRAPRAWAWRGRGGVSWSPAATADDGDATGVHLRATSPTASGEWSQTFVAKKDQHYRVEAVVTCDCPESAGGLVLSLAMLDADWKTIRRVQSAPLRHAERFTIRHYCKTDRDVRRIELSIGLHGAGFAAVHDVRVLPVLEPDARSHPWAVPPPPFAVTAPIAVKKVCVFTSKPERPLVGLLRARFGADNVVVRSSATWHRQIEDADGVLLLDGPLPAKLKQMRGLKAFAQNRIVILSLPTMERISNANLAVRTIKQVDDPLHARVAYGDFLTAGFALRDMLPFAGPADEAGGQVQRQFRTNRTFREYLKRHEFEVLLESETDQDATSEKPIALFHRTRGGAIVVMDCTPAEAVASSFAEPTLAAQLILNALGAPQPLVGQYIAPARESAEFLQHLRDTVERFSELTFTDRASSFEPHAPQMIMLGRAYESLGLPIVRRPMLMFRSGLTGSDTVGAYAMMLWFKHLLRPAPFTCPYTNALDRAYRLSWIPLAAPLQPWGGWQPDADARQFPIEIEFEPGSVAACVDVAVGDRHAARIVTSGKSERLARIHGALPALADRLLVGRNFHHAVTRGADPADRRSTAWRCADVDVRVERDDAAFKEAWHRNARSAGADLIRIELPATLSTDPAGDSIWLTDWAITLLELLSGLMLGTVLVNREATPLTLEVPAPLREIVARGTIRPIQAGNGGQRSPALRGNRLTLPAGSALIAAQP